MHIRLGARGPMNINHCGSAMELALRFLLWMQAQRTLPEWEQIAAQFDIDRATAYRWRSSYCNAIGIAVPPPRPPRGRTKNTRLQPGPTTPYPGNYR